MAACSAGCQGERSFEIGNRTGDQAAVVAPRECSPRSVMRPLIAQIRGLLKCLVVVDSEDRRCREEN